MGQCRFSSGGGGEIDEATQKNCHSTAPKPCYFTAGLTIRREKRGVVQE